MDTIRILAMFCRIFPLPTTARVNGANSVELLISDKLRYLISHVHYNNDPDCRREYWEKFR